MKQALPEKYYLDHFNEFIDYIESVSGHLLDTPHRTFLERFSELDESSQCLLVRLLNRNVAVIHQRTLKYNEIPDLQGALERLQSRGLIHTVSEKDWPTCLTFFTKDQLSDFLKAQQVPYKCSDKKQALMDVLVSNVTFEQANLNGLFDGFWVKVCEPEFSYLLFLFFGNVESRLNQFSLRDLGVRKTQGQHVQSQARFQSKDEALTSFVYAQKLQRLKKPRDLNWIALAEDVSQLPEPNGDQATLLHGRYTLKLARQLERLDEQLALSVYETCALPESEERILRLLYKFGETEQVRSRLEAIIDNPGSEHVLLFAEDFLARKFNQKRTSQLTDVLRAAKVVSIDEMFRHNVEQGVCNYYRAQGVNAYETENGLWRALFTLTYWPELFESETSLCNEFDLIPGCLKRGDFFSSHQQSITQRSQVICNHDAYIQFLTKQATTHFGKPNGLFQWRSNLLVNLFSIIKEIDLNALDRFLIMMAERFHELSDGFPDLTIIENGEVRFEEVKAPGDLLRANQLVTLNKLKEAGFHSSVCRVEWITDPNQAYCVVDIETTGGTKETHRITEIGAVKVVSGEIVDHWQTLVNPERHIPAFITELTGISDDMVKEAPLFSEIADSFKAFLSGSIFVAHNVNFDYGFIKAEFARIEESFAMPKLCTVKEMRRFYPGYDSYGLANLCKEFEIELNNHHRAMSDADATAQLLLLVNQERLKKQQ